MLKRFSKGVFWLCVLGSLSTLSSCTCSRRPGDVSGQVAVKVGDDTMTTKIFADQLARKLKSYDALAAKDSKNLSRAKDEVAKEFVVKSLTKNWAAKNKLAVTDEEVDKEADKIKNSFPDDLAFRRVLAQENVSLNNWREDLRYTLLEKKVFAKLTEELPPLTDEDLKKQYDTDKESFKKKERILLRQIVLDQEVTAERVRSSLKDGAFEDLAKKFSLAPEAKNGGLVGWIEKGSVEIFDKAFEMPLGQPSQVLESPYGFHIFKVEKKLPAGFASFDEVKDQIRRNLSRHREQAVFSKWLDIQVRSAKVFKNTDVINALTVETRSQ